MRRLLRFDWDALEYELLDEASADMVHREARNGPEILYEVSSPAWIERLDTLVAQAQEAMRALDMHLNQAGCQLHPADDPEKPLLHA